MIVGLNPSYLTYLLVYSFLQVGTFTQVEPAGSGAEPQKYLTYSIPIFRTITHPSVYHFRKIKFLFTTQLHNLLKIHPIYVIWAPSSLVKTHRLLYQICEIAPQKAGTHTKDLYAYIRRTYTMSMWDPPPPAGYYCWQYCRPIWKLVKLFAIPHRSPFSHFPLHILFESGPIRIKVCLRRVRTDRPFIQTKNKQRKTNRQTNKQSS